MQRRIMVLAAFLLWPLAAMAQDAPRTEFTVYFEYETAALTDPAQDVAQAAAKSFQAAKATHIKVVGHTDTAEADAATWRKDITDTAGDCKKLPAKTRKDYPICLWAKPDAMKLGLVRAQAVAAALVAAGVPKSAIAVSSEGSGGQAVPTPAPAKEPLNRGTTVSIQ